MNSIVPIWENSFSEYELCQMTDLGSGGLTEVKMFAKYRHSIGGSFNYMEFT